MLMFSVMLYANCQRLSMCVCVCACTCMNVLWLAGVCVCVFMHAEVHAVDHWIQCIFVVCNFDPTNLQILVQSRAFAVA